MRAHILTHQIYLDIYLHIPTYLPTYIWISSQSGTRYRTRVGITFDNNASPSSCGRPRTICSEMCMTRHGTAWHGKEENVSDSDVTRTAGQSEPSRSVCSICVTIICNRTNGQLRCSYCVVYCIVLCCCIVLHLPVYLQYLPRAPTILQ